MDHHDIENTSDSICIFKVAGAAISDVFLVQFFEFDK
jgi:hypothetical protein